MVNVIGVRFKKSGKVYTFESNGVKAREGQYVVVDTANGQEYAEVVIANRDVPKEKILTELKPVLRLATYKDKKRFDENKEREKEAFKICEQKIKEHNLKMKLNEVEYRFDRSKMQFSFTADNRIDFRELVKDLAAIYKTRIELRQLGVRDEVKKIGGNGICGRELCCCSFLNRSETVSIKMAKEQCVSLNPSKISGNCGRLMCCLKYEQGVYEEKNKRLPKIGAIVKTADGKGEVCGVETLKEIVKVKLSDGEENFYKKYALKDIKIIKNIGKEQKSEIENPEDLEELKKIEKLTKQDESM